MTPSALRPSFWNRLVARLNSAAPRVPEAGAPLPEGPRLNLGCGLHPLAGYVNVDSHPDAKADLRLDFRGAHVVEERREGYVERDAQHLHAQREVCEMAGGIRKCRNELVFRVDPAHRESTPNPRRAKAFPRARHGCG